MLLQIRSCINQKNKEYSYFLHTCCDAYHERDIFYRLSVTYTVHIFDGAIIYWYAKKQSETSRISSNAETREISKGVLDKNWIVYFYRSISYPIETPLKQY